MLSNSGLTKIIDTLRSPNYGSYVVGNGISLVGTWMQRIAIGWLTWELTGSPFWLGIIAFADLFPTVIIGPFGGVIADRHSKLRLVQISQFFSCVQAATLFGLSVTGRVDVFSLALLSLFLGAVTALNQPARLALIPSLVQPRHLNSAIGINSVIFNLARFIGPAISGVIIAGGHVSWVFALNALSFAFFLVILLRLQLTVPATPLRKRNRFRADLTDGIIYAARDPRISVLLFLLIAIGIGARPLVELLPGLAAAVFGGGPRTLALLTSTFGVGAIVGGLWLAGRDARGNLASIVNVAAFVLAGALLLFVSTPSLWVALPAVLILGLTMVITGAGIQTMLQLGVDTDMRGRVLSLYGLIQRGGPAIGALGMGLLAEFFGLRWPIAGGAVLVAIVVFWLTARMRGWE
ncbi:MAG: MFS transporter [Alphaproteobacteria bacterium]